MSEAKKDPKEDKPPKAAKKEPKEDKAPPTASASRAAKQPDRNPSLAGKKPGLYWRTDCKHDGKAYKGGSECKLSGAEAKSLLDNGVVARVGK